MCKKSTALLVACSIYSFFIFNNANAVGAVPQSYQGNMTGEKMLVDAETVTEAEFLGGFFWVKVIENGKTFRILEDSFLLNMGRSGNMIAAALSGGWKNDGRTPKSAIELDVDSKLFEKYILRLFRHGSVCVKNHDVYDLKSDLHYLCIFVKEMSSGKDGSVVLQVVSDAQEEEARPLATITTPSGRILQVVPEGVFDDATGLIWYSPEVSEDGQPLDLRFVNAAFQCMNKGARLATREEAGEFLKYLNGAVDFRIDSNTDDIDAWFPNFRNRTFWLARTDILTDRTYSIEFRDFDGRLASTSIFDYSTNSYNYKGVLCVSKR